MKIPLMCPVFTEEMKNAAISALQNERYVLGESVYKFEEEFAKYCEVQYAISTNSGTNALHLALMALNINDGQVIVPAASFVATANAVIHAGGKPVFVDVNMKTYTLDPQRIIIETSERINAIIPVHLYGYPAEMDEINETARSKNVPVIEDAAQAHGALYKGRKAGNLGDVACFSFYPSKNMTVCGDGGMIVTNDKKIADFTAKLRDCGRASRYIHDCIGYTARLNTVNAAIGRVQLRNLDNWNSRRREIAMSYCRLLSEVGDLILPPGDNDDIKPVYHLFVVRTNYRDQLKQWLDQNGVECGVHYPVPIHLQPVYQQLVNYKVNSLPNTEVLSKTCLSIPMHPMLTDADVKYVAERIIDFFDHTEITIRGA